MSKLVGIKKYRWPILVLVILSLFATGTFFSKMLLEMPEGGLDGSISRPGGVDREPQTTTQLSGESKLQSSLIARESVPAPDDLESPSIVNTVLPPLGDKVIKAGSVGLKIKKRKFGSTYEKIVLLAKINGGYIAGSNSNSNNKRVVSGTLTIKVPSKNFEALVARLRQFGKITSMNIGSQDVSQEYVDLDSRLRHWRAQETILLGLMEKAQNIAESITIQQQLSDIQLQIEQITGRLNYLKGQTEFSSLQVTITEQGVVGQSFDRWGFKTAAIQAAHAFVNTINGLILLAGYLSPLLLLAWLVIIVRSNLKRREIVA